MHIYVRTLGWLTRLVSTCRCEYQIHLCMFFTTGMKLISWETELPLWLRENYDVQDHPSSSRAGTYMYILCTCNVRMCVGIVGYIHKRSLNHCPSSQGYLLVCSSVCVFYACIVHVVSFILGKVSCFFPFLPFIYACTFHVHDEGADIHLHLVSNVHMYMYQTYLGSVHLY